MRSYQTNIGNDTVRDHITNEYCNLTFHFNVNATDYYFNNNDIVNVSDVTWEAPFGGGLAKGVSYDVTLVSSRQFIQDNFRKFNGVDAYLKVALESYDVNSAESFTPVKGKIRDFDLFAEDSNLVKFTVYDGAYYLDKKFPYKALSEDYTLHPLVEANDVAVPEYFGRHKREFYFLPVNSSFTNFIGPRNVSSRSHANSLVKFNYRPNEGLSGNSVYTLVSSWAQQSGSTNVASTVFNFEILSNVYSNKVFKIENTLQNKDLETLPSVTLGFTTQSLHTVDKKQGHYITGYLENAHKVSTTQQRGTIGSNINPSIDYNDIQRCSRYFISGWFVQSAGAKASAWDSTTIPFKLAAKSDLTDQTQKSFIETQNYAVNTHTKLFSFYNTYSDTTATEAFGTEDTSSAEYYTYTDVNSNVYPVNPVVYTSGANFYYELKQEAYRDTYTIYDTPLSIYEDDIAISENPVTIVQTLLNSGSYTYDTSAFSTAASSISQDNRYQCSFVEREKVFKVMDEFGEGAAVNFWFTDSGYLTAKAYANSVDNGQDMTIQSSVMLDFSVKVDPISFFTSGITRPSEVRLEYDYNFTTKKYDNAIISDKNNNNACSSVDASGVDNLVKLKSNYHVESHGAREAIENYVKFNSQERMMVKMKLPSAYFPLETSDVIRVQHDSIPRVNGDSQFQVTKITHSYIKGTAEIEAIELVPDAKNS